MSAARDRTFIHAVTVAAMSAPPACPECECVHFVVNDEGCDVCTGCGLVQEGSATFATPCAPNAPAEGKAGGGGAGTGAPRARAPANRNRHVSSRDRWTATLRQFGAAAGLTPALVATSVSVYRRAVEQPDWKNRKHDYQIGILVACMFHACNIHRCHRTPSELCAVLGTDPRNARRMVKVTERAAADVCGKDRTTGTFVPTEILPRFAFRLESLPLCKLKQVKKMARDYYDAVRPDVDNHRPDTITAGLLAAVLERAGVPATDSEIADACLVAPNTVRALSNRITATVDREIERANAGAGPRNKPLLAP